MTTLLLTKQKSDSLCVICHIFGIFPVANTKIPCASATALPFPRRPSEQYPQIFRA